MEEWVAGREPVESDRAPHGEESAPGNRRRGGDSAWDATERGDADLSRQLSITEGIAILLYLFAGRDMDCKEAGDADANGTIHITDAIVVLDHLFSGGDLLQQGRVNCH